ncbi:unnamed protein product, partial [Amoebophrya sp. A25]
SYGRGRSASIVDDFGAGSQSLGAQRLQGATFGSSPSKNIGNVPNTTVNVTAPTSASGASGVLHPGTSGSGSGTAG